MIWGLPAPVVPRSVIPPPSAAMDSNSTQSRRLFAHTGGLTGSSPQEAPLPMLTTSDAQTEDGHAIMELDTFQSLRDLSHAVRECICHEC